MAKSTPQRGFRGMHYAFRAGDTFYPPSEFAMAWIGANSPANLGAALDETVDRILKGDLKDATVPFLNAAVRKARQEERQFNLDDLRLMAEKEYNTTKFIDYEAAMEVNAEGHEATRSSRDTVSMKIDPRRKRSAKDESARFVTLYSPFADSGLEVQIEGGSLHAQKNRYRNNHWNAGINHEQNFVNELAMQFAEIDSLRRTTNAGELQKDFTRLITIADYDAAVAMTVLAKDIKKHPLLVKQFGRKRAPPVVLPYDFDRAPELAFEAFMHDHVYKRRKSHGEPHERPLFSVDTSFIGKKGYITPMFNKAFRAGDVTKEVVIAPGRHFPSPHWAIIQALEEHFYEKNRRFKGYTLEFPGTQYQTIAMAFENQAAPDVPFSARIIFDNGTGLPYVMYKTYALGVAQASEDNLDFNPMTKVNWAKGMHKGKKPWASWVARDTRTGMMALNMIFEIEPKYLSRAVELLREEGSGYTGYSEQDLRTKYFRNLEKFKGK